MLAGINPEQILPTLEAAGFLAILVGLWATMRPSMVRDYDNRKLPPNPTARILFVGLLLFIYVVFVIAFHSFKSLAADVGSNLPVVGSLLNAFKDQAPLLAAFTLGGLLQLSLFRDLERSLLVWLHSAGHLHQDSVALSTHLTRCEFVPSEDEKRLNRELARRFGVHVTSDFDGVGVVTFQNWRKVASLLRTVRSWNPDDSDTLSPEDRRLLTELETAHERKTHLAMTIVKLVEKAERGDPSAKSLSDLMRALASSRYADEESFQAIEANVRKILATSPGADASRPLRLTGEEFSTYLAQIEGYFQVEYDILLQEIAELAGRSVVLSGEAAADRLESLRELGFGGLGKIEPINFNRFIWIFLLVSVGGFLIMFIGTQSGRDTNAPPVEMLARFAFVMALASLVGAFAGSKRSYASTAQTPWGAYILAGLIAVVIHIAVNVLVDFAKQPTLMLAGGTEAAATAAASPQDATANAPAQQAAPSGPAQATPLPIRRRLPWSMLPFFLVLGICRLARLQEWPIANRPDVVGALTERFIDGVVLATTMMMAFYLAIATQMAFGMELPKPLKDSLDTNGLFGVAFSSPLLLFGFLIGFFVVRDVRRAAHARIIDPKARRALQDVLAPNTKTKALPAPA